MTLYYGLQSVLSKIGIELVIINIIFGVGTSYNPLDHEQNLSKNYG